MTDEPATSGSTNEEAGRSVVIGTAGWAIPRQHAENFLSNGSTLQRYAKRFDGVEINSTFHRSHKPDTYKRWLDSVPAHFRFSVKVPKVISHELRLVNAERRFSDFIAEVQALGRALGPVLLQLPPGFAFNSAIASTFLRAVRDNYGGPLAAEVRNPTWFSVEAEELLTAYRVARVGADPARAEGSLNPGGSSELCYLRLHGSPRTYFSPYGKDMLSTVKSILAQHASDLQWCIFDNTASGAAAGDALQLIDMHKSPSSRIATRSR